MGQRLLDAEQDARSRRVSGRARLAALTVAVAAVTLLLTAGVATALTNEVKLDSYAFDPPERHISPGESIRFRGHAAEAHTATSVDGLWDTGPLTNGQTYTVTFTAPGVYRYYCRFHPNLMTGVIYVGGPSSAPPPAPASVPPAAAPVAGGPPAPASSTTASPGLAPTPEPTVPGLYATVAPAPPSLPAVTTPAPPRPVGGAGSPPMYLLILPGLIVASGVGLLGWEELERRRRGY